jgi:hypothetical protein
MNDSSRIISSGPFKGKKIEFAPTTGVDMYLEISDEFMKKIFGFAPGEYFREKIRDVYDLDISDIKSGDLLEIFKRIHNKKYGALP